MSQMDSQYRPVFLDHSSENDRFFQTAGMKFMKVGSGKFHIGSKDKDKWAQDNEKPQHTLVIPYDFYMARMPISNEEYAAYIKSEGIMYLMPRSPWKEKPNYPVVDVSWKNAMAYTKWLDGVLRRELPFGLVLRLPTEAEWEKAARGPKHFIYPWGNSYEQERSKLMKERVPPVGIFSPDGDSPYGCCNMSGTIEEWTHSLLKPYPYNIHDGRESERGKGIHVTRGGHDSLGGNARCASRKANSDDANSFTGFRLVVSVPLQQAA